MEPSADITGYLQKFLDQFDFLEAILISVEGVESFVATKKEELQEKREGATRFFISAVTQSQQYFTKLNQTGIKSVTIIVDKYNLYMESWPNKIYLSIYCAIDANLAMVKTIANELKLSFAKMNEKPEKN